MNLHANYTSPEYEDVPATIIVQENYENYIPYMGMVFQDNVQMLMILMCVYVTQNRSCT